MPASIGAIIGRLVTNHCTAGCTPDSSMVATFVSPVTMGMNACPSDDIAAVRSLWLCRYAMTSAFVCWY